MSRQIRGSAAPQSGGGGAPAPTGRSNEYFVPRDGIDREVITADICRYLGNDALVRPGQYENPQTGQVVQGYYITAYRNLTTAMIEDLKADSARWENERRQQAARSNAAGTFGSKGSNGLPSRRSNSPILGYRDSATHNARQNYGPTNDAPSYPDNRDPYDAPRYPGSHAPGYSASTDAYGQTGPPGQPQYGSGGGYAYPPQGGAPAYPAQPDPRDPGYAASQGQGYGRGEPYTATAANSIPRGYPDSYGAPQGSSRIPAPGPPPQGQSYMNSSQQSPAGYGSSGYGYPPPPQPSSYGASPVPPQESGYGRVASPGGAGPGFNPAPPQQYEQIPNPRSSATPSNAQMAGSGQRRDRDSVDRHHPSDRHRAPRR
ncbi:hypothetical protein ACRALDRAFT_2040553 [Sodiomyces alcalophilus JCM 7366]|uniref:uncharacterized protein n=1 Tax=Sodiomyces alcalophilus JCM 7366 TaxID=591952 RepID=UPI0039B6BF6C